MPLPLRLFGALICVSILSGGSTIWGQAVNPAAKAPAGKTDPAKLAAPEPVTFDTKDGLTIHATYYKGANGKRSIPVLCLPGWGGSQGEWHGFALKLQASGQTVLTVDLRGHGKSTSYKDANGDVQSIDYRDLKQREIEAAVLDIRGAKKFLVDRNNAGECNIEALCVVASDVTCLLAMNWALYDWDAPVLPAFKQGQDVKALVLLSPESTYKGLTNRLALQSQVIRRQLSILVAAGQKNAKALAEAKKLHTSLGQLRPKLVTDEDRLKKTDLFLVTPDTELQGAQLLSRALPLADNIERFIELRLVNRLDDFIWSERRNPLGN